MARKEMICPFSEKLCRDCALYIGRHYFLCYKPGYKGYVKAARRSRIRKVKLIKS